MIKRAYLISCARRVSGITFIRYAQSRKVGKQNKLNVLGSNKTKGPKHDSLNESGMFLLMYLDHDLVKKTENKGEQKSKM